MLCENPWPGLEAFSDPDYNYSFFYCKDNAGGNLLPDLSSPPKDVGERLELDILSEKLFVVAGERDALGVRVMRNP